MPSGCLDVGKFWPGAAPYFSTELTTGSRRWEMVVGSGRWGGVRPTIKVFSNQYQR
jgi:hypothetical protein